ncbi:Alginate lyase [Posidoniimonas corsicana]|uniref:Alginate lyase n=1 Tax=Posidoniimonas corsicana TaxID=1938618 RepID=A0A5C5VGN1_9BACT|nr:LamG-like jellyroll fold domain-containing protein [Posidoniimonas corsicana]TWT37814.1 Alginate lyase [Posidoniimonas corsicana]
MPRLLLLIVCLFPAAAAAQNADRPFVHPGMLHTAADLDRVRARIEAGEEPWLSGWRALVDSPLAQLDYRPRPLERVVRGGQGQNFVLLARDVHAAYQLALRWRLSGDDAYADKAAEVINAWTGELREITGNSDRFLAAGIYGYQFANAAELLRGYPGWSGEDLRRCQRVILEVFYPMNHDFLVNHNDAAITNYWANWDLCNMAAVMSIGVLCDRRDLYDEALNYFHRGHGNGAMDKAVYFRHPGNLGQWQEAGRDQGHTTLGISLMGPLCETAWNQGDDLYSYDNHRLLAGAEYVARYNLGEEVPYQFYAWGIGQRGDYREQPEISAAGRGALRPGFELVLNHYTNRLGVAAPYSERYAARLRPERGGGGHASTYDQVGFGTLTATREPEVDQPRPSGLTARRHAGQVVLSWWGAAGANEHRVLRASSEGGPYEELARYNPFTSTHTDANPPAGECWYAVAAVAGGKVRSRSQPVRFVSAPRLVSPGSADSGWLQPADGAKLSPAGVLTLDGERGHAALPPGVVSGLSDFTFAVWVRLDEARPWSRVFDFGDDRGRYLFLTPRSDQGGARFAVASNYRYNEQRIDSAAPLPVGRWTHVAVTLSGRTGTLYVDGQPVGQNEGVDYPPHQLGRTPENWIGRSRFPSDPPLAGQVQGLQVYDGALTDGQVAKLAERPPQAP